MMCTRNWRQKLEPENWGR